MKSAFILFLFIPILLPGQQSGKIVYNATNKIDLGDRADRIPKEMLDRIPKERKAVKELLFNTTSSYYKDGVMENPEDTEIEGNGGGIRMRMRFMGGDADDQTYKNLESDQIVEKTNLMGKDFIIKDELPQFAWKITGARKQILNYLVMEATTTLDDTIAITAWFTPQIPVSNGPGIYHGLPGMILEVNRENGKTLILANQVELMEIQEGDIEQPKKGKEVSREEFRKIRREKMEEMREQRGGGRGEMRIIRGQ